MDTLYYSTTLTTISCGTCHIPFALPTSMYDSVRENGAWFYCPNGHAIHYYEDENSKLKKKVANQEAAATRLQARLDQEKAARQHAENRVTAMKGVVTKTKKRQAKGVCPAPGCKRHFVDVQRHIQTQHPDYAPEAT